jgi:hypothetical protein
MGNNPYRKRDQPPAPMLGNAGEQSPLLAPGLLRKQGEQKSFRRKRKHDTLTQQRLCEYQYWFPPNQSHLVPSKKAIKLSPTEYSQGQVQEVGTAHQHFPASEREADPFFCRDCFPFRDSHSLISMRISTFHSVTWINLFFPSSILQCGCFIAIALWIN